VRVMAKQYRNAVCPWEAYCRPAPLSEAALTGSDERPLHNLSFPNPGFAFFGRFSVNFCA